jgi:hypothetical protein
MEMESAPKFVHVRRCGGRPGGVQRAGGPAEGIHEGAPVADRVVIRCVTAQKDGLLTTVKEGRETLTDVR